MSTDNAWKPANIKSISVQKRGKNEKKKDELIVYLAHDIKTPLTVVIGYLSLLDEIEDMPLEQRKKYIELALNKSYRLEELINELFDIARFNSEKIILEKEELKEESGLSGAEFCHKGGFLMTTSTLEDAIKACKISQQQFHEQVVIVNLGTDEAADALLFKLPQFSGARIVHMELPDLPPMEWDGIYGESTLEKQEWKAQIKDQVKKILKSKPEAVYVQGDLFAVYPLIHALRKRHMPVLVMTEKDGEQKIVRIPSGS